jgi:hypothetical protein
VNATAGIISDQSHTTAVHRATVALRGAGPAGPSPEASPHSGSPRALLAVVR